MHMKEFCIKRVEGRAALNNGFWVFAKAQQQKNNIEYSNVVPHRSTNPTRQCLTSLSRREAVLSLWYGRSCHSSIPAPLHTLLKLNHSTNTPTPNSIPPISPALFSLPLQHSHAKPCDEIVTNPSANILPPSWAVRARGKCSYRTQNCRGKRKDS